MIPQTIIAEVSGEGAQWRETLAQIAGFRVTDDRSFHQAGELCKLAKRNFARLDARRTEITKPLLQAKRSADDLFREPLAALEAIEAHLKGEISGHVRRLEAARVATMQAAEALVAAGVVPTAIVPETPAAPGVSIRTLWDFEIVDAAAVPRDLCSPDEKKIKAAIWYANTPQTPPRPIEGVRFFLRGLVSVKK